MRIEVAHTLDEIRQARRSKRLASTISLSDARNYAEATAAVEEEKKEATPEKAFSSSSSSSSSSSASGAGGGGKGQGRGKAVALRVNSLSEVGDALSTDCVEALERCWKGIEAGDLLSLSLPLPPASSSSSSSSAPSPGQGLGSAVAAADEPSSS